MIKDEKYVVETIISNLEGYTINDDNDLQDFLHEIIDGMIDIYTADLFDSGYFLYVNEYLTEVDGDIIMAIQQAQYEYYRDIADDNMTEIYESIEFENEEK